MTKATVDINDEALTLKEMVRRFGPKAEVTVKDGNQIIGRFVLAQKRSENRPSNRMLGLHEGAILYMAEDFDAPLPEDVWLSGDP